MIISTLQEIGLSKKEAEMYSLLLELGVQSAAVMGKRMEVSRSTSQFLLNSLVEKGFANKTIKNKITCYIPEKPDTISKLLDVQTERFLEEVKKKKEKLEIIKPLLGQMRSQSVYLPKVTFYEGVDNVVQSYNEFLEAVSDNTELYNYVCPAPEEHPKFRKMMGRFIKQREERNIFCKMVCTYCKDAVLLHLTDNDFKRKTYITSPKTKNLFGGERFIAHDRILSMSYSEHGMFSTIIINDDIAKIDQTLFENMWERAKIEHEKVIKNKQVKTWMKQLEGIKEY